MNEQTILGLATGDDKAFETYLDESGKRARYDAVKSVVPDAPGFRRRMELDAVTAHFTGADRDSRKTNLPAALVNRKIFGSQDSYTPEGFDAKAREWGGREITKREQTKTGFDAGVAAFLGDPEKNNVFDKWKEQKDISTEAGEAFGRAQQSMRKDFGDILPLAKQILRKTQREEGVDVGTEDIGDFEGAKLVEIYKRGDRDKFLYLLGKLKEGQGEDIEGGFSKAIFALQRGFQGIVEPLGRKMLRLEEGALRKSNEGGEMAEAEDLKHARQILQDTKNLGRELARVEGGNMVTQGLLDSAQSLPYMALMASPAGAVTAALSIQEQHMETIREIDPSVSEEDALWVATASAPIEVGIEKLQFMGLGGKFPGVQGVVDKLTKGGLIRRIMATTAGEYAQETVQDAVLPSVMDVSAALNDEMPEGDWSNFEVMDARRFFAVLPLSILGGGGQYARDKFAPNEVGDLLQDESQLRMSGATVEEASAIAELAKENPDAALQKFRSEVVSKDATEKNKIGDAAMSEIYRAELGEGFKDMPLVTHNAEGEMIVDFRDGREERVDSPAEAQVMVDEWMREDFLNTSDAMKTFAAELQERSEGENDLKIGKPQTFQNIADSGRETEGNLKKGIQVYYAQMGQPAPDKIDLANYTEEGSVRLRNRLGDYAVRLSKGANPLTVAEEFSEGFIRRAVQQGETTFDDVKTLLDDFGAMSDLEMTEGFDVDPERAVIEGFSKFAKAYALQGKYDSMPKETQAWMKKAWNIMENPDSLPGPLRAMAELFAKMFKVVHDVAKAIEFHKTDGNGLDSDLESLAQRALGLDEKRYAERMESQYRKELMEDLYDPSEELSQQIKGKLPRPKDPAASGYEGELSAIFDRFKKTSTGKNGKKVRSTVAANKLFAKTGEGVPLESLIESLNEEGFQFDTPADLLDAIEESQRGSSQWPVTMGEGFAEMDSFSIAPTAQLEKTEEAISRLFVGPTGMVDTGRKLRKKLGDIRERYEKGLFGRKFSDVDSREIDTLNALMQLNAIASVLPSEVRSAVGSPVSLVTLKSQKARERNVIKRLDKISLALDKHLQKELRESIRKELDKSGFKVSDSRRRKGKIGKIGHEVVEQVRQVMTMDLDSSEAEKARLTKEFDDIEEPQAEDFERWDSRTLATDLFYDYENATTSRLEQAHEFITTNYKEGRKEWLAVLKARKEERDQFVAEAISFMGDEDRVWLEDLTKAENSSKGIKERASEGLAEFLFSNHHTLARIVENAKDKDAAREWYNKLLDSRIQGDIKADRESDEKQQAFFDKVADIIGAKGATQGHDVRKWLYEAKRTRKNKISTLEGESKEQVSVDKGLVESLLRGEVAGIDGEIFTPSDIDALSKKWEKFEDLPEGEQNRVRKVKFERVVAQGERRPVGELSQAEALQWWLTMRQPDQREKLEGMGWDNRTMEEIESFLSDEVKAVGIWMSEDLVKDGVNLSDVHAQEFGIGLNTGENYFPVRNRIVDQPVQMDMNDPGAGRTISPGSLKERVVNRARPAQANAFGTYFQHVTEMAYWKHNVGWVRQYGGAMKTKAFSEAMEAKVGKHAANTLQKYLGAVQNRGVNAGRQMLGFERLVKGMLSRVSLAVLGARVSTMWVNATAFVNALGSPDVSATAVMRNFISMAITPKGEMKAAWRNELAVMRRRYGASFEAQLAMKSGNAGHWLIQDAEKLAQKGLIPMNVIDVATNTLTMAAVYKTHFDAATKRGESEQEAHEFADAGVTRAHATLAQPTLAVSRSQAEMATSQNPFMGLLTMFMSEARKNAANNYVAYRTLFTGKGIVDRATAARQAAVYTLVYTGVVQAFRGLYNALTGDDEEDEKIEAQLQDPKFWTYAIASDNLRPIPVLGDVALSMMAGPLDQEYWDQKTPFARAAGQWKQTERIFDENTSDSAKIDEVIDQMQSWGAVLPGGQSSLKPPTWGTSRKTSSRMAWATPSLNRIESRKM